MADEETICWCPSCTLRRFIEGVLESDAEQTVIYFEGQLDQEEIDLLLNPAIVGRPEHPQFGRLEL